MGELHGTKALVYMLSVLVITSVMIALKQMPSTFLQWEIMFFSGYAFGNTALKKHTADYTRLKEKEMAKDESKEGEEDDSNA